MPIAAIDRAKRTMTLARDAYADNNYIHHIGVFYKEGLGVMLSGVGNRVSHNLIHDGPRAAIGFMGNNLVYHFNQPLTIRVSPFPPSKSTVAFRFRSKRSDRMPIRCGPVGRS